MKILIVGGAGYIGSHMVKILHKLGISVVTLDNLSSGHRDAVIFGQFIYGDFSDRVLMDTILSTGIDAVMHFASFIQVGESVTNPSKYYKNNLVNTLCLMDALRDHGIKHFIFSSTAAVFGEPQYLPIDEQHPLTPINPYGRSKLMVEQVLADYDSAYGLKSVCLRYFNAAGADPECQLGERHLPETHLIPLVLQATADDKQPVNVYGRDYDTPDGTCIRDYIHVNDLCTAHWLALLYLRAGSGSRSFNLGNGNGFSVQEVISTAERITGRTVPVVDAPRRNGDPARLVADSSSARQILGWNPSYPDLETMIKHAWNWELSRG